MSELTSLIDDLTKHADWSSRVADYRYLQPKQAAYRKPAEPWPQSMAQALQALGIHKLFSHQAKAVDLLRQGRHTGVITPTASGKTLIYNLAVTDALLRDGQSHALYLFPLKALAQDQFNNLKLFFEKTGESNLTAAIYDGDTPAGQRAKIKKIPPRVIFTNPDMLHYGLLAYPENWRQFFKHLKFIIIDEAHTYRGVFGSHVALILRRLWRMLDNRLPTIAASSATMANAGEFLHQLTGVDFTIIEKSGAPRQGRHVVLVNPIGSPYSEAAGLLEKCLDHDIKTIVFTKSRKITELITMWVQEGAPEYMNKIAAYRSGYLPEERRAIEKRLFKNDLSAVISTSALEAGIDVGGLDAAILVGYPGTMISTWQRVGRAGRGTREALMVLIAMPDALDQYFLRHPESFFNATFENCVLDAANAYLLAKHLPCAAQEKPLTLEDQAWFTPEAWAVVKVLVASGDLKEHASGAQWFSTRKVPHRHVDIRSVGEHYVIKEELSQTLMGKIDSSRAFKECHPGAIYLHAGGQYEVTFFDAEQKLILVKPFKGDWYTQYTSSEEVEIMDLGPGQIVRASSRSFETALVQVRVTERVVSYERRRVRDQSLLSEHKLTLPPRVFETQAVLLTVPDLWRKRCLEYGMDFAGGIHAVEHTMIAALPVEILCDRWDLGGLSTVGHPQVNQSCIFVYDGFPGGVGLAAKGLEMIKAWINTSREMVTECDCEAGCPACIHSPKCGSRNQPLDKQACEMLFNALVKEGAQSLRIERRTGAAAFPQASPIAGPEAPLRQQAPAVIRREELPMAINQDFNLLVFDLETQKSAAQVGGWHHSDMMRMSLGVVYDHSDRSYTTYREEQVQELIQHLLSADMVVGFNIDHFDLQVLSYYSRYVNRIKTFDMLPEIKKVLTHRLSLDALAKHTLGQGKTAEGLQAIAWFEQSQWDLLEAYCQADVALTKDLFFFALRYGYLLYERQGEIIKIPLDWNVRLQEQLHLSA